jgi:hypothetical protein
MTNLQLLLTIGIPSLLVVLSWLSNNARFAAIDKQFDRVDRKFEQIDQKFEEIDRRFDEMERRFETRFQEMELRFERRFQDVISAQHKDALVILQSMTSLHERVAVVEAKQALAA